jgi:hypothetical protein
VCFEAVTLFSFVLSFSTPPRRRQRPDGAEYFTFCSDRAVLDMACGGNMLSNRAIATDAKPAWPLARAAHRKR